MPSYLNQAHLQTLDEAHKRFDACIHAYCLMGNHYHLLIETPRANLDRIMRHINGIYTQRYNQLRRVAIAMLVFSGLARIIPPGSVSIYPVESITLGCDQGRPEAFCNIGDIAVSGGGQCGFCGGVGRFEATFPIAKDIGGINRSGWSIQCDENGDNRYDGGKAIVYCQKIGP